MLMRNHWTNRAAALCAAYLLLAGCARAVPLVPPATFAPTSAVSPVVAVPLKWHASLEDGLALAAADYRPVLLLFSSDACPWCERLKQNVLVAPAVRGLLEDFVLVELDTARNPTAASVHQVRGVPAVRILASDGRVQSGFSGYVTPEQLRELLKQALNPAFLERKDRVYADIVGMLSAGKVASNRWADVMVYLGDRDKRSDMRGRVLKLEPFPFEPVVALLEHRRLAVRLGALEILEELSGTSREYDPWNTDKAVRRAGLQRWQEWCRDTTNKTARSYAALTEEQLRGYVQDLISPDRGRSVRALDMIQRAGPTVLPSLSAFLADTPDLPEGARRRVKEAGYAVQLDTVDGVRPAELAHRLLFGTLDIQLKTITSIASLRRRAMPVLREFFDSENALVRETAVDSLAAAGGWRALGIVHKHLAEEEDADVVYACLKAVGRIENRRGVKILLPFLASENEDHVTVALQSLAKLPSRQAEPGIVKCLADERWRVRAAALEAVAKLKLKGYDSKVSAMLSDPDEFVRFAAVKTLSAVSAKKSVEQLEAAFLREDALKGAIVAAFGSMDVALPKSFARALEDKEPDVLVAVLQALEDCQPEDIGIAAKLMSHDDISVACSATRVVASEGMDKGAYRAKVAACLAGENRELTLAVLESLTLASLDRARLKAVWQRRSVQKAPVTESRDPVAGLLDAFLSEEAGDERTGKDAGERGAPGSKVEELLSAFLDDGEEPAGEAETCKDAPSGITAEALVAAVEAWLQPGRDKALRFAAAEKLVSLGNPKGLPILTAGLATATVRQRGMIASVLEHLPGKESLALLRKLLRDPSEQVREQAVSTCFEKTFGADGVDIVFEELLKDDTRLAAGEVDGYQLRRTLSQSKSKAALRKWAIRLLAGKDRPKRVTYGVILLESCWRAGDERLLEEHLVSADPYRRRAAWRTLGKGSKDTFTKRLAQVAQDSSERVRTVVPLVYTVSSNEDWINYLDKDTILGQSRYWYSSYSSYGSRPPKLPENVRTTLLELTEDPSPHVRVKAFFCLLSCRVAVDLVAFAEAIDTFPDVTAMRRRLADYLSANYKGLGPSFRVLLPYLEGSRVDETKVEKIRTHFGVNAEEDLAALARDVVARSAASNGVVVAATFLELPEADATNEVFKLVYFTSPGCRDCERVAKMLGHLRESFPELEVETHNIRKVAAMQLNEALGERFDVPSAVRLVTPAVFGGAGYLIKKEVVFERLGDLIARSATVPLEDWYVVDEAVLSEAGKSIGRRYSAIGVGVVTAAGALDGVNPCAFATIIFLLSYLQVTKRRPRDIAQIGLAFIAGVFLAYFVLGLGLIELVARLTVLRFVSRGLNWIIAAFALVIMLLSLRDGVRCLRGQLTEITLQLPGFLKARIHGAIRRGARHRRFVLAAFVVGVVISFLELACTGQVYAPTIVFMLKTGENRTGAIFYLLAYNLAFVFPLFVIFALASFGLTNVALARWLQKHAATVKFCTAALFLVLFVVLAFGPQLAALGWLPTLTLE